MSNSWYNWNSSRLVFQNLQHTCGKHWSCHCLPNIKNRLECVSTEHSLQNNLFFLIIPLCPVFLDSKSGENIQVAPGERNGPGIQERGLAPAVPPEPCIATLLLSCPHFKPLRTEWTHRCLLERFGTARGDVRAPCCSIDRALCLNMSSLQHCTVACIQLLRLIDMCLSDPCGSSLSCSPAPCSRAFSPEAGGSHGI